LDTVIQSLYIGSLRLKRSPLVQSGDISHPTKSTIGVIIADNAYKTILRVVIILLYASTVFVDASSFFAGSALSHPPPAA